MLSAKDSKGKPVAVGDTVVVRGRVVGMLVAPSADLPALLKVEWENDAPMIDYVKSTSVSVIKE